MKDLRDEPSGWFLANTPRDNLPRPLGDRNPIRWVEVMPAVEPPPPFVAPPLPAARAKLPPELRAVIARSRAQGNPAARPGYFHGVDRRPDRGTPVATRRPVRSLREAHRRRCRGQGRGWAARAHRGSDPRRSDRQYGGHPLRPSGRCGPVRRIPRRPHHAPAANRLRDDHRAGRWRRCGRCRRSR